MVSDIRDYVLTCPVCQSEKSSTQIPGGQLVPLEIPVRKWDQVAIDFVTSLPEDDGYDSVMTVVDKATKMVYFIPCTKTITAKETAELFWQYVGSQHGIPSVLISDRDVRLPVSSGEVCGGSWGQAFTWDQVITHRVQGR